MKTFALEILNDEFRLVTYYTVRWGETEDAETETDKFFSRFLNGEEQHREHFNELVALLKDIGNRRGAKSKVFERYADEASELPPKQTIEIEGVEINYGENLLRLFCTRISDNIVVLFNGGIKSSQATQDSPDLVSKFRDAKYFAKKIWAEIDDGMIVEDEARHKLFNHDGSEELIIY